jgi:hypothetical protein
VVQAGTVHNPDTSSTLNFRHWSFSSKISTLNLLPLLRLQKQNFHAISSNSWTTVRLFLVCKYFIDWPNNFSLSRQRHSLIFEPLCCIAYETLCRNDAFAQDLGRLSQRNVFTDHNNHQMGFNGAYVPLRACCNI